MSDVKKPCPACPFTRSCERGVLGGSPPEIYMGQAFAPFQLPCHMHYEPDHPGWKAECFDKPQCAGAAIFRANMGISGELPQALHRLPSDHQQVFSNHFEFFMHHKRINFDEARHQFRLKPLSSLVQEQLSRADNLFSAKVEA